MVGSDVNILVSSVNGVFEIEVFKTNQCLEENNCLLNVLILLILFSCPSFCFCISNLIFLLITEPIAVFV